LNAAIYHKTVSITRCPVSSPGIVSADTQKQLEAYPLDHGVETWGYRLTEFDQRTILPDLLPEQVKGKAIGQLKKQGQILIDNSPLYLKDVSALKIGQVFAFILDTRKCEGASTLAQEADLMVCESTYLSTEQEQAYKYRHLTAAQAAEIAHSGDVGKLVLLHFSQRYATTDGFYQEASAIHPDVIIAKDGMVIDLPRPKRPYQP
jgi:ribonuclease Z